MPAAISIICLSQPPCSIPPKISRQLTCLRFCCYMAYTLPSAHFLKKKKCNDARRNKQQPVVLVNNLNKHWPDEKKRPDVNVSLGFVAGHRQTPVGSDRIVYLLLWYNSHLLLQWFTIISLLRNNFGTCSIYHKNFADRTTTVSSFSLTSFWMPSHRRGSGSSASDSEWGLHTNKNKFSEKSEMVNSHVSYTWAPILWHFLAFPCPHRHGMVDIGRCTSTPIMLHILTIKLQSLLFSFNTWLQSWGIFIKIVLVFATSLTGRTHCREEGQNSWTIRGSQKFLQLQTPKTH